MKLEPLIYRAYVGADENPDSAGRDLKQMPDGKVRALFSIFNSGKTPALNLVCNADVAYGESIAESPSGSTVILTIHGSHSMFKDVESSAPFTEIIRKDTRNEKEKWWVYGSYSYEDVFGSKYSETFRFWLSWNNGPTNPPGWYV